MALLLASACGDGPGPSPIVGGPAPSEPGIALSSPIAGAKLGADSGTVVFASASSGTRPGAASATVENLRTGERLVTSAIGGGFDPVPLLAREDDDITVTLLDSSGHDATSSVLVVRAPRPRLVRTSPAARQTDVPLNTVIEVVFSAPMAARARPDAIRLFAGGREVAGILRTADDASIAVGFEPTTPLEAETDYELRIAGTLRDVVGTPLGADLTVPFRTGTATAGVSTVRVAPEFAVALWAPLLVGESMDLVATAYSADGVPLRDPIAWELGDGSTAMLRLEVDGPGEGAEGRARVVTLGPGQAVVRARLGGAEDSIGFSVLPRPGADVRPSGRLLVGSEGLIWSVNADGSNARLLAGEEMFSSYHSPSIADDGTIALLHALDSLLLREPSGQFRTLLRARDGGMLTCPHIAADGSRVLVAQVWERDDERRTELAVVSTATGEARVIRSTDWYPNGGEDFRIWGGIEMCAFWSPDGRSVAYSSTEDGMDSWLDTWVMSEDGTARRRVIGGYAAGPWSPDGQFLAVHRFDPSDLARRPPFAFVRVGDGAIVGGVGDFLFAGPQAWSPDGRSLALSAYNGVEFRFLDGLLFYWDRYQLGRITSAGFITDRAGAALDGS